MATLANLLERVRGIDLESWFGLRPPYPPIAIEIDRGEAVLVRLKQRRGRGTQLEGHAVRPLPDDAIPASIFDAAAGTGAELTARLQELFEKTGAKPGRLSLVLPDNLAKISLLDLPERPASSRQLDELVRSKMRRAVPFRLEDACLSYQILPGEGRRVSLLVVLVRRSLVEQFERSLEALGTRLGLIDICTPNLINLCRNRIAEAARSGGDVALINCSRYYFSLVIVRGERLVFFRCKTFAPADRESGLPNGTLAREVGSSLSYYREKLNGEGIGTVLVRSAELPLADLAQRLARFEFGKIEAIDPLAMIGAEGPGLDAATAQRLAPAIGAAIGRGR